MWPFKRKRTFNLDIFMKSGNVIEIDDVIKYSIDTIGDEAVRLEIFYHARSKRRLLIKTIALSQIEAVVRQD